MTEDLFLRSVADRRRAAPTLTPLARRQRRAKRLMVGLTALCALGALSPAVAQLLDHGWSAFIYRAPGVGATPSGGTPASVKDAAASSRATPAATGHAHASNSAPSTAPAPITPLVVGGGVADGSPAVLPFLTAPPIALEATGPPVGVRGVTPPCPPRHPPPPGPQGDPAPR